MKGTATLTEVQKVTAFHALTQYLQSYTASLTTQGQGPKVDAGSSHTFIPQNRKNVQFLFLHFI